MIEYCQRHFRRFSIMRSQIGSMNNVKIFVLYLMRNINYPLDFVTLNEIVMQTDYIMYLDFAVAFHEMLDGGLISEESKNEQGESLYSVTDRGRIVAEQLKSDILPSILEQSLGVMFTGKSVVNVYAIVEVIVYVSGCESDVISKHSIIVLIDHDGTYYI